MSPCALVDDSRTRGGPCRDARVGRGGGGLTAVGEPVQTRQDGGAGVPGTERLRDPQAQSGRSHRGCDIWRGFRSKGVSL